MRVDPEPCGTLIAMPTLILMRHAQAGEGFRDFTRPLAPRGREQAAYQAGPISERVGHVDLALVSAAKRTKQTVAALKSGGLAINQIQAEKALYGASWMTVLGFLNEIPERTGTVLVVGHEPTMSISAARLADDDSPANIDIQMGFSTASAAIGRLDSWRQLDIGGLYVTEVLRAAI